MNFTLSLIIFICISLSVLMCLKIYIYKRFLRDSFFYQKSKKWIFCFFGLLLIMEIFFLSLSSFSNKISIPYNLYILSGLCIVILYALFLAVLLLDICKTSWRITKKCIQKQNTNDSSPNDPQRRLFLKIILDLGVLCLFFLFAIKGIKNALQIPEVKDVVIKLPKLQTNKTIAMITDIHIGKALGKEFLCGLVEKINALQADIVVIVGDLVDDKIENVKDELLVLNQLKSKEGIYYVTGNHEYYHGIEPILAFLQTLNITILHNTNIELEAFNLAGVTDLAGLKFKQLEPDLESAKQNLNKDKPSILLAHQPKFIRQNDISDFDLALCGHTHAGQVFPLSFFVWLDQHYVHGLYKVDSKTQLYVSSGAGFWGPAIRFMAPSEIVHLHLEA